MRPSSAIGVAVATISLAAAVLPGGRSAWAQDAAAADADELQRLRTRIAALERQVAQPRNDVQSQLLQDLSRQIAALREELAREEANRVTAQAAQQAARQQLQESVVTLTAVEQRLETGDSQVAGDLDTAAQALPFPAQQMVQEARTALQRNDLASARYSLAIAIGLAQRAQLTP